MQLAELMNEMLLNKINTRNWHSNDKFTPFGNFAIASNHSAESPDSPNMPRISGGADTFIVNRYYRFVEQNLIEHVHQTAAGSLVARRSDCMGFRPAR
jgi:hypothetical protein